MVAKFKIVHGVDGSVLHKYNNVCHISYLRKCSENHQKLGKKKKQSPPHLPVSIHHDGITLLLVEGVSKMTPRIF